MKILFITGFCGDNWSAPVNVAWRHISWGLLQLCPYLKQRGHSVFLFHPEVSLWKHQGNLEDVLDEFKGEIRRIKPEILGVNAISTMIEEVILFAKYHSLRTYRLKSLVGDHILVLNPNLRCHYYQTLMQSLVGSPRFHWLVI